MVSDRPQQFPPRLDGHSYAPSYGLYDTELIVPQPPNVVTGSVEYIQWLRTLPRGAFRTIYPQSMAELLSWLRYHRDTVSITMTVRRRTGSNTNENMSHPVAFRQAAAALVDGIAWLNMFAGEVVVEPRCDTKLDASAVDQLEELIEAVKLRLPIGLVERAERMVPIKANSKAGYLGIFLDDERHTISRVGISLPPIPLSAVLWEICELLVKCESDGVSPDRMKNLSGEPDARRKAISTLRGKLKALALTITDGTGGANRVLMETAS